MSAPASHCFADKIRSPNRFTGFGFRSGVFQFPRVRNVVRLEWTHLASFQSQQRDGVAFVADEFHLERRALAMHQYRRAHVPAHQAVGRQVAA